MKNSFKISVIIRERRERFDDIHWCPEN